MAAEEAADGSLLSETSIGLDSTPTGEEEVNAFSDPNTSDYELEIKKQDIFDRTEDRDSKKQDRDERKHFAESAKGITQAWVGFLMVVTFAQMTIKGEGLGLTEKEFIVVFTTTTASVFGFWVLVGRYLFPSARPPLGGAHKKKGPSSDRKKRSP